MMHAPVRTVAPTVTPVILTEAKAHLRVDHSDEDALITSLIGAAVSHLDGWSGVLGLCLEEQTWRQDFDGFGRNMRLPLAPVISVTSVSVTDSAGDSTTVDGANYVLLRDEIGPYIRFDDDYSIPSDLAEVAAVSITFVAGHAQADSVSTVPAAIRAAILLMVGHWYAHREAVTAGGQTILPMAVDALIAPLRRIGI